MKKFSTLLFVIAVPVWIFAQSLSPTVISSTGGFSANANGSLSYTVGEMTMVQTFTSGGNILTQGFQQPNDNLVGLIDMTEDEFGSFAVYPNPAVDNLWFGFQFPEAGRISIAVYDVLGQKVADVYNGSYSNGKTTDGFQVVDFAAGSYYLALTFTGEKDNRTRVISKPFQVIN